MCKIISIANNKGGTGKTTTTLNLGAGLAMYGRKVLFVDLDPQANLTASFGLETSLSANVGNYMLKKVELSECLVNVSVDYLHMEILPSALAMATIEKQLVNERAREVLLKNRFEKDKIRSRYDFVLIDCPPNLGEFTANAFAASDQFLVPYQAEYFSYIGTGNLFRFAEMFIEENINSNLSLLGIVITRYNRNERNKLKAEIVQTVEESGTKVFSTYIRHDSKLIASPMDGQSIYQYAPTSNGAKDYDLLTQEILKSYEQ